MRSRTKSRLAGRVGWNIIDQALSALSNVLLSIVVARSVDATSFGAFAVAFVVFGISLAVTKSVVGQPLQIRFSDAAEEVFRQAVARSSGLALLLGLAAAAVCLGARTLVHGTTGQALLALAVVLPGLVIQDTCRMAFFAKGDPRGAALIDAVWALGQVLLLSILVTIGHTGVELLIIAWGLAAAVSAVLGMRLLRVLPRPTRAMAWLREQRDLHRYLFAEYFLGLGASQIAILLVALIASTSAVGSLRAAQVLLGPLAILGVAAFQFAVPEIARRPDLSARGRTLFGTGLGGSLGLITTVYVTILLLLPRAVGVQLFGDSWDGAAAVLLPMGISSLASSLANGPAGVLYGMGEASRTFRINLVKAPVILFAVLLGAWLWGPVGAAWGLALAEITVLPLWLRALRRAVHSAELVRSSLRPEHAHLMTDGGRD